MYENSRKTGFPMCRHWYLPEFAWPEDEETGEAGGIETYKVCVKYMDMPRVRFAFYACVKIIHKFTYIEGHQASCHAPCMSILDWVIKCSEPGGHTCASHPIQATPVKNTHDTHRCRYAEVCKCAMRHSGLCRHELSCQCMQLLEGLS